MKILIYGTGVLGSLYAARIKESGQDISILARGKRLSDILWSKPQTIHALAARGEMKEIADEFRELARKTSVQIPAMDNLYKYIDPDVPPIKDVSSGIPLKW